MAVDEDSYLLGSRAVWQSLLSQCCKALGVEDPQIAGASWLFEREATVAALRAACGIGGDNEWSPDLHLADVVDKHLLPYLREAAAEVVGDGEMTFGEAKHVAELWEAGKMIGGDIHGVVQALLREVRRRGG